MLRDIILLALARRLFSLFSDRTAPDPSPSVAAGGDMFRAQNRCTSNSAADDLRNKILENKKKEI